MYDPADELTNAVLVDRLWPRGIRRTDWPDGRWLPEVAPTAELRRWFHEDPEGRFDEFAERYRAELDDNDAVAALIAMDRPLTLATATRNPSRSHVSVLADYLTQASP